MNDLTKTPDHRHTTDARAADYVSAAVRRGTQTCEAAVVETSTATGGSRPGQFLLLAAAASAIGFACYAAYRWGYYSAKQEARRRHDNNNDSGDNGDDDGDNDDDDDEGDDEDDEEEYEYE